MSLNANKLRLSSEFLTKRLEWEGECPLLENILHKKNESKIIIFIKKAFHTREKPFLRPENRNILGGGIFFEKFVKKIFKKIKTFFCKLERSNKARHTSNWRRKVAIFGSMLRKRRAERACWNNL